jgi:hypothetical protein
MRPTYATHLIQSSSCDCLWRRLCHSPFCNQNLILGILFSMLSLFALPSVRK